MLYLVWVDYKIPHAKEYANYVVVRYDQIVKLFRNFRILIVVG